MNLFLEALAWLFSPDRLEGANAITNRIAEHLFFTAVSVLIAAAIAIPIGYLIGHTGRGREVAVAISGAARALPSFGLILALVLIVGVLQVQTAVFIAFVVLAIPSILAGAYAGLEAIERNVIDSARAVGMTEWQILWKVEIPLGLPLLIGGLRSGALQVVATVTLAAYVGLGGLGYPILQGLDIRRFDQMLGAAIVVVLLALVIDGLFATFQHFAVPRGVASIAQRGPGTDVRSTPTRRRTVVGTPIEEGKR
jgi:osmoprotectant transport system permease protein